MSGVFIYVEGGGFTNELRTRCRNAVTSLLAKCGFAGRMPRIIACGSRNEAYDKFVTAHGQSGGDFAALLVDSEKPVIDVGLCGFGHHRASDYQQPQANGLLPVRASWPLGQCNAAFSFEKPNDLKDLKTPP